MPCGLYLLPFTLKAWVLLTGALLLGSALPLTAQKYPAWQKVYIGAEGFLFPHFIMPRLALNMQLNLGYQHSDRVGFGLQAGGYQTGIIRERLPFRHKWSLIGLGFHYRVIFRKFQAQVGAGRVMKWTDYSECAISCISHTPASSGKFFSDYFLETRVAWRPLPSLSIGVAALLAPNLTMTHRYQVRVDRTMGPIWMYKHYTAAYSVVQPYIGVQLPGRWKGWSLGRKNDERG
jgi:hypothetical protein